MLFAWISHDHFALVQLEARSGGADRAALFWLAGPPAALALIITGIVVLVGGGAVITGAVFVVGAPAFGARTRRPTSAKSQVRVIARLVRQRL